MGLQVWLPLTKDLHNQGLTSVSITNNGATYSSTDGKLGGCYGFDGSNDYFSLTNFDMSGWAEFTLAFWCYTSTNLNGVFAVRDSGTYRLALTDSSFTYRDSQHGTLTSIAVTQPNQNIWTHYVISYNNGIINIYQDGNLIVDNVGSSGAVLNNTNEIRIGRRQTSSADTYYNGKLNDFRIYDNCLSEKEIKEIAKGLILHYPLNRRGLGQENLANFSSILSNWTMDGLTGSNYTDTDYGNVVKLVTSAANKRMYHNVTDVWTSGQVYTVSFLAKATTNGITCDMSRSIADFSQTFTLTTDWKRYRGQITSTATPGGGTLSFRINSSSATVYITQIKLEKGNIATAYCPHSSETIYSSMNLGSTIEYDYSGFNNNGTRTGTFSYLSNTPKYEISTKFNGSEKIVIPLQCGNFPDAFTASIWGYENDWNTSSAERLFGAATSSSGWCIGDYGSENTLFGCYANGSYNTVYGFKQLSAGWHHFVITFDGLHITYYVDGEIFGSKTFSSKQTVGGTYNIHIGSHYGGSCPFKGQLSDARIYATALSATDVLSLYQNNAYIDQSGQIYGPVR